MAEFFHSISYNDKVDLRIIAQKQKIAYNRLVSHLIQSWQWGEFRQNLGTKIGRFALFKNGRMAQVFQLTFHQIPLTNFYIGYLPKGPFPDKQLVVALKKIGQDQKCAFIKIEPNVEQVMGDRFQVADGFIKSSKSLFTKYNYILDLTQSEEKILKNMHPKFRYNIKIAQKHGVKVEERTDDQALEIYLQLYFATTKRQGYHGHSREYHRLVWKTLKNINMARLLIAFYQGEPLVAWMLLNFKDTLYYPYGGSSTQYKNVMASNLVAWEAIKLGQKLGLKKFDLWGASPPNATQNDPFFGFTRFKSQMGAEMVEYLGTYDLVFNWPIYYLFNLVDRFMSLKILLLKLVGKNYND